MTRTRVARALTIAGSDSGGGAGIQADLKAFAHCGVHGMSAITAITAQNTVEVRDVYELPAEIIVAQVRAVAEDIGVDVVKIGMLASEQVIEAVNAALDLIPDAPVVLDPVMVAESGAQLLEPRAVRALVDTLVPRAAVVTPNLHEAGALCSSALSDERSNIEERARVVLDLGPKAVVVTGGHGAGSADDLFFDGSRMERISGERYSGGAAHGSGCTHSSALAAFLARGLDPLEAARRAKQVASRAVRDGLGELGAGPGPVDVLMVSQRARSPDGI